MNRNDKLCFNSYSQISLIAVPAGPLPGAATLTEHRDGRKRRWPQPAVLCWPASSITDLAFSSVKHAAALPRNCSLVSNPSLLEYFQNCVSRNPDCRQDVAVGLQQQHIQLCLGGGWCHFHFRHGYTPAEGAAMLSCFVQPWFWEAMQKLK